MCRRGSLVPCCSHIKEECCALCPGGGLNASSKLVPSITQVEIWLTSATCDASKCRAIQRFGGRHDVNEAPMVVVLRYAFGQSAGPLQILHSLHSLHRRQAHPSQTIRTPSSAPSISVATMHGLKKRSPTRRGAASRRCVRLPAHGRTGCSMRR